MTQQRKLWITITSVVLVISLLASILLVFADEYVPTVQPTPSPIYTGQPFTQPGNGQVEDHVEDGTGSNEFYTVQTHNGNTFYIVIDKDRMDDNAYLLSQVDERDLMEFVEEEPVEETPQVVLEESPVEEPEEPERSHSWIWTLIILLAIAGGAAYWYFRMYLPGQEETTISESEGMETPETEDAVEDFPTEEEEKKEESKDDQSDESV